MIENAPKITKFFLGGSAPQTPSPGGLRPRGTSIHGQTWGDFGGRFGNHYWHMRVTLDHFVAVLGLPWAHF